MKLLLIFSAAVILASCDARISSYPVVTEINLYESMGGKMMYETHLDSWNGDVIIKTYNQPTYKVGDTLKLIKL